MVLTGGGGKEGIVGERLVLRTWCIDREKGK